MKLAISIWCAAMLSLFAVGAKAQLDSNAIVKIYCGSVEKGCQMYLTYYNENFYTSLNISFDSSFRIADEGPPTNNGMLGQPNPSFKIDSETHQIVNLSLYSNRPASGPLPTNAEGMNVLMLTFHPIPYTITNGQILCNPGNYECHYFFYSFLQHFPNETDQCSDSGTVIDSLFLRIQPSQLSVNYHLFCGTLPFRVIASKYLEFDPSSSVRVLEIVNAIGQQVIRKSISNGETSAEVSLPPGCYFARLGDQVAKFIVPPR